MSPAFDVYSLLLLFFSHQVIANSDSTWTVAHQASLYLSISRNLPQFMSIESGTIQPSHPLSPSSPSAFNLSQHQGLFQKVSFSHQVAKVLELQIQHHSFQRVFKVDFFRFDWFNFLALPGTLESFPASQLKSINSSALCLLYFPALSYTFIV